MGEITFARDTSNYQRETISTAVFEVPPRVAVIVALVLPETRFALMVSIADVVQAATVTLAGTVATDVLLLLNVTVDNFFLASVNRGYGVGRNSPGERKTITPSEKRVSYTPAPRETISQLPIRTKFIPLQPSCEKLALAQSRGWARNSQFLRRC